MTTTDFDQLFERLARSEPKLRAALELERDKVCASMIRLVDEVQLRNAQGRAQAYAHLVDRLSVPAKAG